MAETLKQRTAKGLFWAVLNSGTTQVLNLVFGIFLARLLSPSEYGIVGVLAIFTAIAGDLQSAGFTQGLINLKKPTARDYNSVFSFNVCMSVTMYTILFFSAPLIADFFHQECLVSVSRLVFLCLVISSIGIAHGGYMTKNMMNKELAIIGALALLISGVTGITLAMLGYSYWSLAWQQITYIVVVNFGRYYYVREWRPRLTFDFVPVMKMAPFAVKILVTKIINTTSNNVLTFIFGHTFPIRAVGNYSQAFKWDTMASSLVTNTVGQIAQTVLVEASPSDVNDADRSLRVYRKMMRFTCFLAMPIMLGLSLVSREFILFTIGERWEECIPLLQVLCISGAFLPIYTMYQNLTISQGRSDVYMWLNIMQVLLQIGVILVFHSYGMLVMVSAYSAFVIAWLLPWHCLAGRLINYRLMMAFADIMPFVLVTLATMSITYFLTSWMKIPAILLPSRVIIAAIIYYGIMKMLRVEILRECEEFILSRIKK